MTLVIKSGDTLLHFLCTIVQTILWADSGHPYIYKIYTKYWCNSRFMAKFMAQIWTAINLAQDHKWPIPMASFLQQGLTLIYQNFSQVACDISSGEGESWDVASWGDSSCICKVLVAGRIMRDAKILFLILILNFVEKNRSFRKFYKKQTRWSGPLTNAEIIHILGQIIIGRFMLCWKLEAANAAW